jgi:ABC-type lipoprotein export system ATPase subunit
MDSLTLRENIMLPTILDNIPLEEMKRTVIRLAKQFEVFK